MVRLAIEKDKALNVGRVVKEALDGDIESLCFYIIEPLSKNEFLFTYGLKSSSYEDKESGQTDFSTNLSAWAPQLGLEPRTP